MNQSKQVRCSAWVVLCVLSACAAGEMRSATDAPDASVSQAPLSSSDSNDVGAPPPEEQEPATTPVTTTPASNPNAAPTVPTTCPVGQQTNGFVGGPSTCCSGAYQVCDDFESEPTGGSPNAKFWQVELLSREYGNRANETTDPNDIDHAAIIEISEDRAARGKKSLHIVAQNSNLLPRKGWHHDMLVNRTIFPAPNNSFWGRAFVYYVKDASSDFPHGHATLANASGVVHGSKDFYTWWRLSTYNHFLWNCEHGDGSASTPELMPTNRWACLEWHYQGDASNVITLYMDGKELVATTKTTSTTDNPQGLAPVYDTFRIGWEQYLFQYNPTPKQFDMYYDEIALDYSRIGCDK